MEKTAATQTNITETVEEFLRDWDRKEWMTEHGEWESDNWQYQREDYDWAASKLKKLLLTGEKINDGHIEQISDMMRHLEGCLEKLKGHVAPNESDYIAEGTIDPDFLKEQLQTRPALASAARDGWDCRQGWNAYRLDEALVLQWWRHGWKNRRSRDLWVVIDGDYFPETEIEEVELDEN